MSEQWRIGPYTLTPDGAVYSVTSGRYLRPRLDAYGYWLVDLTLDGKRRTFKLHRLLAIAFISPAPFDSAEVDHINGDRADNRIENLRWVNSAQNKWNRHAPVVAKSGHRGVRHRSGKPNPWQAYHCTGGRFQSLGHYPSLDAALSARAAYERSRHA